MSNQQQGSNEAPKTVAPQRLLADIVEKVEIGMTAFIGSACVEAAFPQSIAS